MCVQVCPTGIDIRNGLQYQCIGCAACVDACDDIMEKMGYARGLVAYTTESKLAGGTWTWKRPKLLGYGVAMLIMSLLFAVVLWNRVPLSVEVIRDRGSLYQQLSDGSIQNVYRLRIINMDNQPHDFVVELDGLTGARVLPAERTVNVSAGAIHDVLLRVLVDPAQLLSMNQSFTFRVNSQDGQLHDDTESRFISPSSAQQGL
jgi:cytochrome c oxidase accessory protein FixG